MNIKQLRVLMVLKTKANLDFIYLMSELVLLV